MRHLAIASIVVLGFVGSVTAETTPEPRVALIIGNSAYQSAPLANPANDARLMAGTLRGLDFEVIELIDADQKAMKRAIVEFGDRLNEAGKDAVGLFFYAGHGLQVNGLNYLVPLGAEIERESHVDIEAVSATWVLTQMEYAGNRTNFVILDACRNNPLVRSFRSAARGLARMDAPRGSLIAYSTGPGKVARDGDGANSPYTAALVREMRTPGVPVEQMFKQVRVDVMARTRDQQVPWEASSLTGNFQFVSTKTVPNLVGAPTPPEVVRPSQTIRGSDDPETERLFWESIRDSANPEVLEAYLERYPDGAYSVLARIRLKEPRSERKFDKVADLRALNEAAGESEQSSAVAGQAEIVFWNAIEDSDDPAEYHAYLAKYENGHFADLAESRLRKFKETRTVAVTSPPGPSVPPAVVPAVGTYSGLMPGDAFKDCDQCPEVVVIPAGSFVMGSPADETGRDRDEGPQFRVTLPSFAVGKYEVTFAEWDACAAGGGCRGYRPDDQGWGRGNRPVISTSWNDAREYVRWLSERTGKPYRLLSEAEWEYAARAGTTKKYWWGTEIGSGNANCDGCGSRWDDKQTAPVGSFSANAFGLRDMAGNVWEWVEDCAHGSYQGAPTDGAAWTTGVRCGARILRGGSWASNPKRLHSANRFTGALDKRRIYDGFRVATTPAP